VTPGGIRGRLFGGSPCSIVLSLQGAEASAVPLGTVANCLILEGRGLPSVPRSVHPFTDNSPAAALNRPVNRRHGLACPCLERWTENLSASFSVTRLKG